MNEEYRDVKILIQEGNLRSNKGGFFTLSWPGHEDEKIQSMYRQAEFILGNAKEFVDAWLADGYIQLNQGGKSDGNG